MLSDTAGLVNGQVIRNSMNEPQELVAQSSGSGPAALRVVVADDDVLLREGLASWLTCRHVDVVGQAGDADELLTMVREKEPELVIVDIRMPPTQTTEGLDAARRIRDELPHTAILLLSNHVETNHTMQMLASWRQIGYLLKTRVVDAAGFLDSLQRIANGALVLDPALMPELFNARRRAERLAVLSAREKEVLALMAEGRSNAGIAVRLRVTEATVSTHVRNIFMKLELPDAADDHRRVHAVTTYLKAR